MYKGIKSPVSGDACSEACTEAESAVNETSPLSSSNGSSMFPSMYDANRTSSTRAKKYRDV